MIHVRMLNVYRWHRTWSGLVVEPETFGVLEEIKDGLFSVLWPGQVRPVLCLPNTVEVVEDSARSVECDLSSEARAPT